MRICDSLAIVGSLQFGISGRFDCHVFAVRGVSGVVLIDAGGGTHSDKLLRNLAADIPGLDVKALLLTHSHMDHCGGAASIRYLTGCQVLAPELARETLERGDEEACGLRRAREQGVYPSDFHLKACPVDAAVTDGDRFSAAGLDFTAIHVRGHSPDSFCYLTDSCGERWLFTGDAVFYGGVLGLINAEGSDMAGYRTDLQKLRRLRVQGLFPGHGLFTVSDGQRHLDCAIDQLEKGFLGPQIGQGDLLF
jgi:hydroxyacylglutathione hydrolase